MFTHTRVAIICTAPTSSPTFVKEKIKEYPVLIAADGGANHCYEMGLRPDLIIGDFDSIASHVLEAFSDIPQKRFPRDKDKTDLELAIEAIYHPQIEKITVFGALGGRTDHTVGNLILLSRYPGKLFFEDENETLVVIQQYVELAAKIGQVISLIPLNGSAKGIDTKGLKWSLKNGTLDKHFIGMCNEATSNQVVISVKEGDLLCCINN